MACVFSRVTKLKNVCGRSNYITNEHKQEEIVLHKTNMKYDWKFYAQYELANQRTKDLNNEALEVFTLIPNELYQDKEKLEQVCDDLASELIGPNHDYEYAAHWNHNRTSLHVHFIFSERELNLEAKPKTYKKDIWHDKDTHKLAKANSENAILVHKKGEVQLDKDGNIKYDQEPLTAKDTKFKSRTWLHDKNKIVQKVLKNHGYELDNHTRQTPYLTQKRYYKGASADYLEYAEKYNAEVKKYNENVKQHITLEPYQEEKYIEIRNEIEFNVAEANRKTKKITDKAIECIHDMSDWVQNMVHQIQINFELFIAEHELDDKWEQVKNKFTELFNQNETIYNENLELMDKNKEQENLINSINETIEDKEQVIKSNERSLNYELR